MELKRKFGKQKMTNPKRGLSLIFLLVIAILLWYNAEGILNKIF